MCNIGLLSRCLRWVDQRELLGTINYRLLTNPDARTDLEHTEVEIPLPFWPLDGTRVLLDHCYRLERERILGVEDFESEVVPVDDNSKVVPRSL